MCVLYRANYKKSAPECNQLIEKVVNGLAGQHRINVDIIGALN
jgi:hypothetical protein